ncbi:MAG: hypothetical protein ACREQW_10165 [Candidatus Binatia bacterium]
MWILLYVHSMYTSTMPRRETQPRQSEIFLAKSERMLKRELPNSRLWVFDEIHKYRSWRNWLRVSTMGKGPVREF